MATHSSILAWETPGQSRLARYSLWCHKSVRLDSVTKQQQHSTYILFSIVFSFLKKVRY